MIRSGFLLSLFAAAVVSGAAPDGAAGGYAVVISRKSWDDPAWKRVAERLVEKYPEATVIEWEATVDEVLPRLKAGFPRHACFVATPAEATAGFVAGVHRLTRRLDDDPYTDVFWGILTGFDAENALAIAAESNPLVVRKAASGTELALDRLEKK